MQFYFAHLMPYADLDPATEETHSSAWVTLSNSYYDPAKGSRLYNRYIDEMEYAETLGFDGLMVNEHHQTAYGLMPTPGVIAGALARATKRVKIAVLGRALPLLNNPLNVAEEYAMLDNISGGRLIAGFVRGIGAEYHSSGVNPTESHDRFHEAHDLIVQAWTQPGPSVFEGKYYHFNYVNTWPRPVQQPHPPIWIPSQGSRETAEWAAAAERRYVYLLTFAPIGNLVRFMDQYRDEAEKAGYEASHDQLGWAIPTYVAETDAIARQESAEHIEAFFNRFLVMPPQMLLPPGYTSAASLMGLMAAKAAITGGWRTIDDLDEKGMFVVGSAATVRERIADIRAKARFNLQLPLLQFGTLPAELTRKNMELFARDVMPYFREDAAAPARARAPAAE